MEISNSKESKGGDKFPQQKDKNYLIYRYRKEAQKTGSKFYSNVDDEVPGTGEISNQSSSSTRADRSLRSSTYVFFSEREDTVRSGESVFKLFHFEPSHCVDNAEKCKAFWKGVMREPDLKPVNCTMIKSSSFPVAEEERASERDKERSEGRGARSSEQSLQNSDARRTAAAAVGEGRHYPWYSAFVKMKAKNLDKLAMSAVSRRCRLCRPDEFKHSEIGEIPDEDLSILNVWNPQKARKVDKAITVRIEDDGSQFQTLTKEKDYPKLKTTDANERQQAELVPEKENGPIQMAPAVSVEPETAVRSEVSVTEYEPVRKVDGQAAEIFREPSSPLPEPQLLSQEAYPTEQAAKTLVANNHNYKEPVTPTNSSNSSRSSSRRVVVENSKEKATIRNYHEPTSMIISRAVQTDSESMTSGSAAQQPLMFCSFCGKVRCSCMKIRGDDAKPVKSSSNTGEVDYDDQDWKKALSPWVIPADDGEHPHHLGDFAEEFCNQHGETERKSEPPNVVDKAMEMVVVEEVQIAKKRPRPQLEAKCDSEQKLAAVVESDDWVGEIRKNIAVYYPKITKTKKDLPYNEPGRKL